MSLAVHGGTPIREKPLPTSLDSSGRTFGVAEAEAVARVIASGVLWRVGGVEVAALEAEFAEYLGAGHAVASTSGTAALHLAIAALNPEPGDEIIVPPITDFGTIIAVLACNAIPVFADVDPLSGCLTAASIAQRITQRTRAVIVVHLFDGPAPIEQIVQLCRPRGIKVVEDCAQAYLTVPGGGTSFAGTRGDVGCFSLQQTKHITAGDGGLTVTDDPALARRMRLFADKGWPRDSGERTYLFYGVNYRMTEPNWIWSVWWRATSAFTGSPLPGWVRPSSFSTRTSTSSAISSSWPGTSPDSAPRRGFSWDQTRSS